MAVEPETVPELLRRSLAEFLREMTRRAPGGVILERDGIMLAAGMHPSR